jgi:hypothetical protein
MLKSIWPKAYLHDLRRISNCMGPPAYIKKNMHNRSILHFSKEKESIVQELEACTRGQYGWCHKVPWWSCRLHMTNPFKVLRFHHIPQTTHTPHYTHRFGHNLPASRNSAWYWANIAWSCNVHYQKYTSKVNNVMATLLRFVWFLYK